MHKSFVHSQYATLSKTNKKNSTITCNAKLSRKKTGSEHQTSTRLTVLAVSQQDSSHTIWFIVLITQHHSVHFELENNFNNIS